MRPISLHLHPLINGLFMMEVLNPATARPQRTALAALIFDVDGTLAETEELHRECFNEVFAHAGLTQRWQREQYGALLTVTGGKERMRSYFDSTDIRLSDRTIAAFHEEKNRRYTARFAKCPPPLRPGVANLVYEANLAGIALGIATTTSLGNLQALMGFHFGPAWRETFATVVCGEMVENKKPDPEVYEQALIRMQINPSQALAVEDSEVGVAAARAAGMAVLATPSLYFSGADFSAADLLLPNLEQGLPGRETTPLGIAQLADWFSGCNRPQARTVRTAHGQALH